MLTLLWGSNGRLPSNANLPKGDDGPRCQLSSLTIRAYPQNKNINFLHRFNGVLT